MEPIELPFRAEYAKSSRANCKGCKAAVGKDILRIAVMVQSAFHDGKQPYWFHESCFFEKQRPGSVGDIENFGNLRFDDQERLKKTIDMQNTSLSPKTPLPNDSIKDIEKNETHQRELFELTKKHMIEEHNERMKILHLEKLCRQRELEKIDLEIQLLK